jgi:hypothetical protein
VNYGNPLTDMHAAFAHAAYEGFSAIQYEDRDWEHYRKTKEDKRVKKSRRPVDYDIEVFAMFCQTWGSTALGFGGVGGQAISSAYVIVLGCMNEFCVYFGGRFAYKVTNPSEAFFADVAKKRMADVNGKGRLNYNKTDKETA